jgi:allophanate hydrolase subunit 1
MTSLAIERHIKSEVKIRESAKAEDKNDPYDIEKCAEWIQKNALKQVVHIFLNMSYILIKF